MPPDLLLNTIQSQIKRGINYVCLKCGTLLYHTGIDGAVEGGEPAFPSRQPWEVSERLRMCPNCGRDLNLQPDPDEIRITWGRQEGLP